MDTRVEGTYASPNSARRSPASDLGLTRSPQAQNEHQVVGDGDIQTVIRQARSRDEDAPESRLGGGEHVARVSPGTNWTNPTMASSQPTSESLLEGRSNHRSFRSTRRTPIVDPSMTLPNPFTNGCGDSSSLHRCNLSDTSATAQLVCDPSQLALNLPTSTPASAIKQVVATIGKSIASLDNSSSSPSIVSSEKSSTESSSISATSPPFSRDHQSKMNNSFDNSYNSIPSALPDNGFMNGAPQYGNMPAMQLSDIVEQFAPQAGDSLMDMPPISFDNGARSNGTPQMTTYQPVACHTTPNRLINNSFSSVSPQGPIGPVNAGRRISMQEAYQRAHEHNLALTREREAYQKRLTRAEEHNKELTNHFQQQIAMLSRMNSELISQNTHTTSQNSELITHNQWFTKQAEEWKHQLAVAKSREQGWMKEARTLRAFIAVDPPSNARLAAFKNKSATPKATDSTEGAASHVATTTSSSSSGTNSMATIPSAINNRPQPNATSAVSRASKTPRKATNNAPKSAQPPNGIPKARSQAPAPSVPSNTSAPPPRSIGPGPEAAVLPASPKITTIPPQIAAPHSRARVTTASSNTNVAPPRITAQGLQAPITSSSLHGIAPPTQTTASGPQVPVSSTAPNGNSAHPGAFSPPIQAPTANPTVSHTSVTVNNTATANPAVSAPGPVKTTTSDSKGKKRSGEGDTADDEAAKKMKRDNAFASAGYAPAAPAIEPPAAQTLAEQTPAEPTWETDAEADLFFALSQQEDGNGQGVGGEFQNVLGEFQVDGDDGLDDLFNCDGNDLLIT